MTSENPNSASTLYTSHTATMCNTVALFTYPGRKQAAHATRIAASTVSNKYRQKTSKVRKNSRMIHLILHHSTRRTLRPRVAKQLTELGSRSWDFCGLGCESRMFPKIPLGLGFAQAFNLLLKLSHECCETISRNSWTCYACILSSCPSIQQRTTAEFWAAHKATDFSSLIRTTHDYQNTGMTAPKW